MDSVLLWLLYMIKTRDKYTIVDGFHRYEIFKKYFKAKEIPIIVLEHDIEKRMAQQYNLTELEEFIKLNLWGN